MKSHKLIGPVLAAALAFSIGTAPVAAKGSNKPKIKPMATSNAAAKAPKVTTPKAKAPKANAVKVKSSTPKAKAPKANAVKVKSNTPKTKAPKAKTQTTSGINTPSNSNNPGNSNSGNSNSGSSSNSNNPGDTSNVSGQNKAQQLLAKNTNLRTKLQSRLPPNTDINAAAAGFKNLGQFVAAVNVSHNHGIAFTDLKALMTGDHPLSLGQALQRLRGMDANNANQVANPALNQANQEINASNASNTSKDRN